MSGVRDFKYDEWPRYPRPAVPLDTIENTRCREVAAAFNANVERAYRLPNMVVHAFGAGTLHERHSITARLMVWGHPGTPEGHPADPAYLAKDREFHDL